MQEGITLTKASFILNIISLLYSYNNGKLPFFITGDLPAKVERYIVLDGKIVFT